MIIKTAIALILTASLAGGAVFFGTQGETDQNGEVSLGEHPHKTTDLSEETEEDDVEISEDTGTVQATESTIDRLLNRSSDDNEDENSNEETETSVTTTTEKTVTETVETVETSEDQEPDLETQTVVVDEALEPEINIQGGNDLYGFSMTQASRIETIAIRDQAYLDIVDYACKNKDYNRAQSTVSKIDQIQMRDKARSHIAISMAQRDMAAMAFAEIDKVETAELQDTMRLQVLQALIQK